MAARRSGETLHFTKARLEALHCPEGADRLVVYDAHTAGLGCRIMATGRAVFFWAGRASGAYVRMTLGTLGPRFSVEDARTAASGYNAERPKPVEVVRGDDMTIEQAFDLTLAGASRGEMATRDWNAATKRFLKWKGKAYPRLKLWKDIPHDVFAKYLATRENVSATRRRLDLQPIMQTARHMWTKYRMPNLSEGLAVGSKLDRAPRAVYVRDVLSFLDFLRENAPRIEVGAALQGLAGLQLLEVLRLTWDKVDLQRGLVEISGEVKNTYRNRVIPVCGRVLDALRRAYDRVADRPDRLSMHVVLSDTGLPYLGTSALNYGKILTRLMRGTSPTSKRKPAKRAGTARETPAKATILPNLAEPWNRACEWQPKDLRNCLPTMAAMEGILSAVWEQYIGHAARGVTARHYIPRLTGLMAGEADALNDAMDVFHKLVVSIVERAIERAQAAPAAVVDVTPQAVGE